MLQAQFSTQLTPFAFHIDIHLPTDGINVVLGASGSGKSTLLRAIAGLEKYPNARCQFNQHVWQDATCFIPPHQRKIGFLFQRAALFPHLSVKQNILFSSTLKSKSNVPDWKTIVELLHIASCIDTPIYLLSQGEQQRIALARALMSAPQLLLLDEPFSSIDQQHTAQLLPYIKHINEHYALPILYVTHSHAEAAYLADYLIFIEKGHITQHGTSTELRQHLNPNPYATLLDDTHRKDKA